MVDRERELRLEELFQLAADLPASERAAFILRHCGGDAELGEELRSLLAEDELRDGGFLDRPLMPPAPGFSGAWIDTPSARPASAPAVPPGAEPDPRPPLVIDRYRILETLGEGGMGVVFLAEQIKPVRRRVALKVVKPGMDTRQVLARFEAERQALALMDHPCIASIFDGGETSDGRPFFAMEFVSGLPLIEYCDRERLSTGARLQLFRRVCDAVQHAHQKGVIHRDLKPSNVLVTLAEGEATPKVIDFGIARATTQPLTEKTLHTRHGEVVGTLRYMSPEQADPLGLDIDSRTDIYSLGVVLYELAAGSLPFEEAAFRGKPLSEVQRMLRESEPPTPSSRITRRGDTSVEIADRRRTDMRTLRGELRGDLDWITMKALEKDRSRRYASASELAADIERHLNHEPVLAGPPGVGYRMLKFARRHRMGVAAGSLVTLALVVGLVLATWGLLEASRERDAARHEAARAEQILDFLTGEMLGSLTVKGAVGKPISVKQMLDSAGSRIDACFPDDPIARRRLHRCFAEIYRGLGYVHEAAAHDRKAGPPGDGADPWMGLLIAMQRSLTSFHQIANTNRNPAVAGKQGWASVARALAEFNRLRPGLGAALGGLHGTFADRATHREVWPKVQACCRKAVEDDPRTARAIGFALCFFASAAHVNTVSESGIPLVREALEIYRAVLLPPTSPEVVQALLQLSLLELDAGHREEAFRILDEVPEGALKLPEDSPARSAITQLRAIRLASDGEFESARRMLLVLLPETETAVGTRSATRLLVTLKWIHDLWGRPAEAAGFRERYLAATCEGRGGFLQTEIPWFFDRENPELAAACRRVAFQSWSGEDGLKSTFEEALSLADSTLEVKDAARYLVGRALVWPFAWRGLDATSQPALIRRAAALVFDHDRQPLENWLRYASHFAKRGQGEDMSPFLQELLANPTYRARLSPADVARARAVLAEAFEQAGRSAEAEALREKARADASEQDR